MRPLLVGIGVGLIVLGLALASIPTTKRSLGGCVCHGSGPCHCPSTPSTYPGFIGPAILLLVVGVLLLLVRIFSRLSDLRTPTT